MISYVAIDSGSIGNSQRWFSPPLSTKFSGKNKINIHQDLEDGQIEIYLNSPPTSPPNYTVSNLVISFIPKWGSRMEGFWKKKKRNAILEYLLRQIFWHLKEEETI